MRHASRELRARGATTTTTYGSCQAARDDPSISSSSTSAPQDRSPPPTPVESTASATTATQSQSHAHMAPPAHGTPPARALPTPSMPRRTLRCFSTPSKYQIGSPMRWRPCLSPELLSPATTSSRALLRERQQAIQLATPSLSLRSTVIIITHEPHTTHAAPFDTHTHRPHRSPRGAARRCRSLPIMFGCRSAISLDDRAMYATLQIPSVI